MRILCLYSDAYSLKFPYAFFTATCPSYSLAIFGYWYTYRPRDHNVSTLSSKARSDIQQQWYCLAEHFPYYISVIGKCKLVAVFLCFKDVKAPMNLTRGTENSTLEFAGLLMRRWASVSSISIPVCQPRHRIQALLWSNTGLLQCYVHFQLWACFPWQLGSMINNVVGGA